MTMTQNEKMESVRAQQSLSPKTDRELAQAYSQGYQDGRRGLDEVVGLLRESQHSIGGDWRARRDLLLGRVAQAKDGKPGPDELAGRYGLTEL